MGNIDLRIIITEDLTEEWMEVLRDPANLLNNPNIEKENLSAELNIKANFSYEGKMTPDRLKKMHKEFGELIQEYTIEKVVLTSWLEK